MPEAEDETIVTETENEYAERITDLTAFLIYLLNEREKLSEAIRKAKESLPIDMDSEVSLNAKRQETVRTLRKMDSIRSSEISTMKIIKKTIILKTGHFAKLAISSIMYT